MDYTIPVIILFIFFVFLVIQIIRIVSCDSSVIEKDIQEEPGESISQIEISLKDLKEEENHKLIEKV